MSSTKFIRRDLNRYRKIYPYIRKSPHYAYYSDKEAIIEVGKQDCEAVFISCTNLKTFKIINEAEKVLDKPVVSSNQAISWQMLREAGINSTAGPGILFSKH